MLVLFLLACMSSPSDSGTVAPEVDLPEGALAVVSVSRSLDGQVVSGHDDPASLCPEAWVHVGFSGLNPVCVSPEPGVATAITHRADGTPLNLDDVDACGAGAAAVGWNDRELWCYRSGAASVVALSRLSDGAAVEPGEHTCPADFVEVGSRADRAFCVTESVAATFVLGGVGTEPLSDDALDLSDCPAGSEGVGFLDTSLVCLGVDAGRELELTRAVDGTSLAAADGDPSGVCPSDAAAVGFRGNRAVCELPGSATIFAITRDVNGTPRVSGPDEGRICPSSTAWLGGVDSAVVCGR